MYPSGTASWRIAVPVLIILGLIAATGVLVEGMTPQQRGSSPQAVDRQQIDCSYAGISIYSASYTGRFINISVQNTGRTELGSLSLTAHQGGVVLAEQVMAASTTPDPDAVQRYGLVIGRNQAPDRIQVTAQDCPDITDTRMDLTSR